jgi:hypothetical protein
VKVCAGPLQAHSWADTCESRILELRQSACDHQAACNGVCEVLSDVLEHLDFLSYLFSFAGAFARAGILLTADGTTISAWLLFMRELSGKGIIGPPI